MLENHVKAQLSQGFQPHQRSLKGGKREIRQTPRKVALKTAKSVSVKKDQAKLMILKMLLFKMQAY